MLLTRILSRSSQSIALLWIALVTPFVLAQAGSRGPCPVPEAGSVDVASVKAGDRSSGSVSIQSRPDSLAAGGTVFHMIEYAYNLRSYQIAGGPGWTNTATWEMAAKVDQPPADWPTLTVEARNNISHKRMQTVLAQRFGFKCHFEMQELPVYNLVIAKGGAKLASTPANATEKNSFSSHGENGKNRMQGAGVTMDSLASNLSQSLGRTAFNKTGLTGIYNFALTWTSDAGDGSTDAPADASSGPSLFTAVDEQLGLRLQSAKGPVVVLVIDSLERPTEN